MGALRINVGTSIATQQAPSIGNSIVTLAVISVTSTMPVRGDVNYRPVFKMAGRQTLPQNRPARPRTVSQSPQPPTAGATHRGFPPERKEKPKR
jgi:hypothetical protein